MRLLFIHQNLPGQFHHLLHHYAVRADCQVIGIGEVHRVKENLKAIPQGMRVHAYEMPVIDSAATHSYLRDVEQAVVRGLQVVRVLQDLKRSGFVPDVVYAHPGWGEALHVKDVFPDSRLVVYGEFYFQAEGRDVGFDPEFAPAPDQALRIRVRNMSHLSSMEAADAIITATAWQKSCLPQSLQHRVLQVHDGVDTKRVRPDPDARVILARDELSLTADDEVITFVNRNLEPYRGFHVFMRALPDLLKRRPKARVIIVGGDDVSYGMRLKDQTYRQYMLKEVGDKLDLSRVHFVGKLPYSVYLNVLQVSTAHVYLTYPFVLSWSMLEALSAGCLVIGSRTAPVTEVLRDGENGLLVDFFSPAQIVDAICHACDHPDEMAELRRRGRADVVRDYDLQSVCLPRQTALIDKLASANETQLAASTAS